MEEVVCALFLSKTVEATKIEVFTCLFVLMVSAFLEAYSKENVFLNEPKNGQVTVGSGSFAQQTKEKME